MTSALDVGDKFRVLFVAEAVTLAHVARPLELARALDPAQYEVHFAHCPRYRSLLGDLPCTEHTINSIPPEQFSAALAAGSPLYDADTLAAYVEEDLRLLEAVRPAVVVGDFRLSLAVSARLLGVPYVALSNAYWSPWVKQSYTVPELPLTRVLGPGLAQVVFTVGRPAAFALHCLPMRRLRRRYGLPQGGFNLHAIYTDADHVVYADIPELYEMPGLPANHHFIGPVDWSPVLKLPEWWEGIPCDRPVVYMTLGSSGAVQLLPRIIAALGTLELTAIVSTAGAKPPPDIPANVHLAKYLPGEQAAARADLVICNGGSPTTQQALLQGVPVLGLAGNLDQYLNMATLERYGAGRLLRSGATGQGELAATIAEMLANPRWKIAAGELRGRLKQYDSAKRFRSIIRQIS